MLSSDSRDSPGAALSRDAEKAFDRVQWQFLFSTLESFSFSANFLGWINLPYNHPNVSVLINGMAIPQIKFEETTEIGR